MNIYQFLNGLRKCCKGRLQVCKIISLLNAGGRFILISLFIAVGCSDPKTDFSNIENLYAQPLPVIQKCVQGKWKWIEISTWGFIGVWYPSNTVVDITKDSVITTGDDVLNQTFQYSWKEKSTSSSNYTTYVLWNNEKNTGEWYFDKIKNDTLVVYTYNLNNGGYPDRYLFYKIKS